ncbi:biliverdin-producing heme oxygenase [Hyalangium versicolor]|uniref:biliverdin-producing heme oxygenase n=1 Tax=Hyalangium versicolor TaxID=2861190 RepID=UPI001CCE4FF7|nr:biliverdin-producing heme oxygenase [Hyalangium versicolor]
MPAAAVLSFESSQVRIPLSVRLEEGTAATRRETEQTPFLRSLFRGTWGTSVYGQLVRGRHYVTYLQCLLDVYGTLEVALESLCTHPVVGGFLLPELWRSQSLEADLRCFLGPAWPEAPRPTHLTSLHVERIRQLSLVAPHLLVAHAYVRYTRDILAGPVLKEQVARAFDLGDEDGTAFYQATSAESLEPLRHRVNRYLDSLPLSQEEMREVVQEARLAFRLDTLLSDALARESLGVGVSRVEP